MRNIAVYPISKQEILDCLEKVITNEKAIHWTNDFAPIGDTRLMCLELAMQIIKDSDFKSYPPIPIELS